MSKENFYKLRRINGNELHIPQWTKVRFGGGKSGVFTREALDKIFSFALEMSFGAGHHRETRTGGSLKRPQGQIFANTFQGKLSEHAVYTELKTKSVSCGKLDFDVYGEGIWDESDLRAGGAKLNIKSAKHFAQLLLLETDDWNASGNYIPNLESEGGGVYDCFIFVRIKPSIEKILRNLNIWNKDELTGDQPDQLRSAIIKTNKWEYDITGWITHSDLQELIRRNFIIRRGELLNGKVPMDANNYYIKAHDMRTFPELVERLSG